MYYGIRYGSRKGECCHNVSLQCFCSLCNRINDQKDADMRVRLALRDAMRLAKDAGWTRAKAIKTLSKI